MIEQSLAWLREHGRRVVYDAEHFFDGYRADAGVRARDARGRGARRRRDARPVRHERWHRCPGRSRRSCARSVRSVKTPLGVHAHDDSGTRGRELARRRPRGRDPGAGHDQRLRRAVREREPLLDHPDARAEARPPLPAGGPPAGRSPSSRTSSRRSRTSLPTSTCPTSAQSRSPTRAAIHVAAMRRNAASYQHVAAGVVGNQMRVVVSELSGRGNLLSKAEELGLASGGRGGRGRPRGDQGARGAGLLVRGGGGLRRDDDEAPGPGLPRRPSSSSTSSSSSSTARAAASSPRPW